VHRHRHTDPVEGDAVEQDAHVEDAVDGEPGHADVAHDAGVVAAVAAVRRQVEGDAQALLSRGQVALVEGVRCFGRREAGVLAHGPRPGDVHRCVGAAHVRRKTGKCVEVLDPGTVRRRVERLDIDPLGRLPAEFRAGPPGNSLGLLAPRLGRRNGSPSAGERKILEARNLAHDNAPSSLRRDDRVSSTSHLAKMKRSTPAARYEASLAPALPARMTVRAPAFFSFGANCSTQVAYCLSVEQMTAIFAPLCANSAADESTSYCASRATTSKPP